MRDLLSETPVPECRPRFESKAEEVQYVSLPGLLPPGGNTGSINRVAEWSYSNTAAGICCLQREIPAAAACIPEFFFKTSWYTLIA